MASHSTTKVSQAAAAKLDKYAHAQTLTSGQTPPKSSQQTNMHSKPQVKAAASRISQGLAR